MIGTEEEITAVVEAMPLSARYTVRAMIERGELKRARRFVDGCVLTQRKIEAADAKRARRQARRIALL